MQSELRIRRTDRTTPDEQSETRLWERDGSGDLSLVIDRSQAAPQGGIATRNLTLLRVAGVRYGGLDGLFLQATTAPLLDQRLEADPQAEADSLFDAARQAGGEAPACATSVATLPGDSLEASAVIEEQQRKLRILRALEGSFRLEIELTETISCDVETLSPPLATAQVMPGDAIAAWEAFLAQGIEARWLTPAPLAPSATR